MKRKGYNMENIKNKNRQFILEVLEQQGAMSRKDLAEKIKLTQAALTLITNDMLNEGIIYQVGEINENRVGRKKILLDIDYDSRYVIGVNFEKHETLIALSNLKGDLIKLIETDVLKDESGLEKISEIIKEILIESKINIEKISGIGIGMYGHVNPGSGVIKIKGKKIEVVKYFEGKFNKKVILDNNVRALALSEMFFNKNLKYFFFVKYGPGIGSSIVYNKEILYGSNYFAGEIGHVVVKDDKDEVCDTCGKNGCLENYVYFDKVTDRVKEKISETPDTWLAEKLKSTGSITMYDILESAKKEEKVAVTQLEDIAELMARVFLNFLTVTDCEKVILYGEIFSNPTFKKILKSKFTYFDNSFDLNKLELSKDRFFPKDLGGIFLAIKKTFYETGGMIKEQK